MQNVSQPDRNQPGRALLCGLEHDVAQELKSVLRGQDIFADLCPDIDRAVRMVRQSNHDVVFCGFSDAVSTLVNATSGTPRKIPVVVVSRHPEVNQWLDALEAGAADYCAAPFEGQQLRWILQATAAEGVAA